MALIDNVIAWIFVGAFAAVVIGAILSFYGVKIIPDPEHRKWVFRSVLAVMVVAVVGYGAKKFTEDPKPNQPDKIVAKDPPSDTKQSAASSPTPTPPIAQEARPAIDPSEPAAAGTAAISEWAKLNMPPRPHISDEFSTGYPDCANKRLSDVSSASKAVASQCRRDLEAHKATHISKYYAEKAPYDAAIIERQQELSRGRLTDAEHDIFNFLIDENEDFNFEGGRSLNIINTAEARINEDIAFFRKKQ